jgi:hypothetical protein
VNKRVGKLTLLGNGAINEVVVTNSTVTASSLIFISITSSTEASVPVAAVVSQAAGTFTIKYELTTPAPVAAPITVAFWVN